MRSIKYICMLLALVQSVALLAQKNTMESNFYTTHWQATEHALKDDLPATALKELALIRERATKEKNMPQLCRALFQTMHCQAEIVPDSLHPCQEAIHTAMEAETRPAEKAVYQHLLGRCTQDSAMIHASLSDLRMLAETDATQYMPLIDYQRDSRWVHGDDLLSLFLSDLYIINKEPYVREAQKIYAEKGRWAAYYLLMGELNLKDSELYPMWRKAADEHPEVRKVEPIMRYLDRTELASVHLYSPKENVLYPGQKLTFVASARNVGEATLTIGDKRYTLSFSESEPWEQRTDTLSITAPAAGTYEVVLRSGHLTDKTEVHISSVKPLMFGLPDGRCRIALVDAITGRLLKNARLVVRNTKTKKQEVHPAAKDGYIYLSAADTKWPATRDCKFYPQAGTDIFHPDIDRWNLREGSYDENDNENESFLRIFTDRGIYRPGQEVHVGIMAYTRHIDDYKAKPQAEVKLTLLDANYQALCTRTLTTDAFGSASTTLVLPKVCLPGHFSLRLSCDSLHTEEVHFFDVEEYKRPTFEIRINEFTDTFAEGDTARVSGQIMTYTGIALADTEVRTAQGDTTMTDAEGRFSFDVVVKRELGRFWWGQVVELTATASNGESASATTHIPFRWGSKPDAPTPDKHTLPFWHEEKVNDDGSEASITIGSCLKPCMAFLDVVSGKRVVEHRVVQFTDSMTYSLKYRNDWGDGAVCHLAFVRNGQFYNASVEIVRPRPCKALKLRWSTFRSTLQPGEHETWTMHILRPDGTPADALVMARLYDATLDAFCQSDWGLRLYFPRRQAFTPWNTSRNFMQSLDITQKTASIRALSLSGWRRELFDYGMPRHRRKMYLAEAAPVMASAKANSVYDLVDTDAVGVIGGLSGTAEESSLKKQAPQMREKFDETAFFMPSLRTDAEGRVGIAFRLPESLTTWHFTALAHDRDMNFGLLCDTIIARKQLMVEMAAPRFLREGDTTFMPLTLTNLTDKVQECTLTFSLNGTAETTRVSLAAGERITKHFPIAATMTAEGYSTLRATLQNAEFSDGEERLVPVLSNKVQVTRSVPYSMTKRGNRTLDISSLWHHLEGAEQVRFTLEQSTNPMWYVVNALPPMIDNRNESATAETARLYALGMAQHIRSFLPTLTASALSGQKTEEGVLERNADLKLTLLEESPWVMEAKTETERQQRLAELLDESALSARFSSSLAKLRDLQLASGAWSWFKGMEGSAWITTEVCTALTRLNLLTEASDDLRAMVAKAMPWLHKDMQEQVQRMKEYETKHKTVLPIAENQYRYLYLCALTNQKPSSAMRYLIDKCAKANHELTMYGKAGCAVVLAHYGSEKRAALLLKSLVEHSVSTGEMGRYFDTERALSSYSAYKIPTQTFAIEALERIPLKSQAATAEILSELRLWLLQSNRTEMWMTSAASMDAIYALLAGQEDAISADETGTGYTRKTFTDSAHMGLPTLTVENTHDHPVWGAAYVQCLLPADKVEGGASGIKVERKIEAEGMKVGDRIRITYTLRTERDLDFVCLSAARAACMEPVRALSGYDWQSRSYRAVRDTRTDYFFEHLAKGTLTFTEEVFVDRAGTFTMPPATAECCYAPEFRGTTSSTKVEVSR